MLARGATANLIFEFPEEVTLNEIASIHFYVSTPVRGLVITKLKDDMVFLENNSILIRFAQEETLRLSDDEPVEWQFHWRVNNETEDVFVSEVEQQTIYRFLGGGAI